MKFKGAVFDLDGTLLDSMEVWKNIDIEFLSKRGLHGLDFKNNLMMLCMNGIKWP